jgi:dimethylsulfone monooxygenase
LKPKLPHPLEHSVTIRQGARVFELDIFRVLSSADHDLTDTSLLRQRTHLARDHGIISSGVVSGWFKEEFLRLGEPWLDHDERYRRSEEFIQVVRGLLTGETFSFAGDFYSIRDLSFRPPPSEHIEVFQGGNSIAARAMAARRADWYFMNGDSVDGVARQIAAIRDIAGPLGRKPRFGVNAFVILRDSESAAADVLAQILSQADMRAVEAFRSHVQDAGASTKERIGMWTNSDLANLVQPNDGSKTGLIGTPDQVIERIRALEAAGVDLILCGFLDFLDEPAAFGASVIGRLRR